MATKPKAKIVKSAFPYKAGDSVLADSCCQDADYLIQSLNKKMICAEPKNEAADN